MSYPFSSFIALIGETGVVGVIAVASWINKVFRKFRFNVEFCVI